MNDFLFHILSPILQFQQTGMRVAIGRQGPGQKEEVVFPHYSHFHGDNEQQDSLAQVSNKGLRHQCRSCNQDMCGGLDNCYPAVGTVRSDRLNAFLSEAGERLHVELTDSLIRGLGTPQWSENKRKVWEATSFWNIKPGFNHLYGLVMAIYPRIEFVPPDVSSRFFAHIFERIDRKLDFMVPYHY